MRSVVQARWTIARFVLACVIVAAGPSWLQAEEPAIAEVKAAIENINKAFAAGEAPAVRALMTADHQAITPYYGHSLSLDEQMAHMADHKLTLYEPGKLNIRLLDPTTALVTYSLKMAGTYRGQELLGSSVASAIYVKRDGRWLESFYQETALAIA